MIINYSDLKSLLKASISLANDLYDEQISELLPLKERNMIRTLKKQEAKYD